MDEQMGDTGPRGDSWGQRAVEDIRSTLADRYEVMEELGRGGSSYVFRARDRMREIDVALKVLKPEFVDTAQGARFLREIEITRSLRHPAILPLFDAGDRRSAANPALTHVYFTAPFVRGQTLRTRLLGERQLPIDFALHVTDVVADALQYAHEMRVLHRDVKPGNIFLADDGRILLADFGIAKAITAERADDLDLTATGVFVGTPSYMSPEQIMGESVEPRSDQYALACILYEMLAGVIPLSGGSFADLMARRLSNDAPSVRATRPRVPDHVDQALLRALARLPADRFETIRAFREACASPRALTIAPIWGPLPTRIDDASCFMVMPFGPEYNLQACYRDHVVPTVQSTGLAITRADDIFGHREVIRDIWHSIASARLIIADVTGRNANVFYELGMAHTLGKDVIILTQREEDVPFDVKHIRYIKYEYTPPGVKRLADSLKRTIETILSG